MGAFRIAMGFTVAADLPHPPTSLKDRNCAGDLVRAMQWNLRGTGDSALRRNQNRKRTVACRDLGPPVCRMGDSPLPGLPVPSIRFNIEVDWPNTAELRNFTGSAKLAWFRALKASRRTDRKS